MRGLGMRWVRVLCMPGGWGAIAVLTCDQLDLSRLFVFIIFLSRVLEV